MRSHTVPSIILATSFLAAAYPKQTFFAVKETHNPPPKWRRLDTPVPNHWLQLYIGLKSSNFDKLEDHLSRSSNPFHKMYGAHLSVEEVDDLIAPTEEALNAVNSWLKGFGIDVEELNYSRSKDWINVRVPLRKVERMLDTTYSIFEHEDDHEKLIRAPTWSLPLYLHEHIEVVQPTNSFFRPMKKATVVDKFELGFQIDIAPPDAGYERSCKESFVTCDCLRKLYGTIDYKPEATHENLMGMTNFDREMSNISDAVLYLKQFRPDAVEEAYVVETDVINGGNNDQGPENASSIAEGRGVEGNLDMQTMLCIASPTPLTTFNTGGSPPYIPDKNSPEDTDEPYLVWLNAVLEQENLPPVISSSYDDDEQMVPYSYAKKVCEGFAKLGARGISLFFASGDSGVGKAGTCISNDGKNTTLFLAQFPSTCPYVTSVGATRNFNPEIVALDPLNGFVSGGGFSNYFPRPSYQDIVVPKYIETLPPNFNGLYNPDGRGYPDVAAQGYRYAIVWDGITTTVDGTSASTPLFAGIIALVNDALIASGRPPLGFLNPFLYALGYLGLNDVMVGSADGCSTSGFPATKGWDAVTGFGTPQFPDLVRLAMQYIDQSSPSPDDV